MSENNNVQFDRLDSNGLLYVFQRLKTIFSSMFQGKETGKGLSTNDYTTEEKTKLAGIAAGATANVGTVTGVAMNGSQRTVDANGNVDLGTVITSHQDITGKADLASPAFTGTPTVPTASTSTDNTQIASTAFVNAGCALPDNWSPSFWMSCPARAWSVHSTLFRTTTRPQAWTNGWNTSGMLLTSSLSGSDRRR